jgi:hypothetical protein
MGLCEEDRLNRNPEKVDHCTQWLDSQLRVDAEADSVNDQLFTLHSLGQKRGESSAYETEAACGNALINDDIDDDKSSINDLEQNDEN